MLGARYQPSMEEIRSANGRSSSSMCSIAKCCEKIKPRFGLEKLDDKVSADLNLAWHRLDTWPDVPKGFARCSAVHPGAVFERQHRAHGRYRASQWLSWEPVLGSEIARDFKPKPRSLSCLCGSANLTPGEVMMVAGPQRRPSLRRLEWPEDRSRRAAAGNPGAEDGPKVQVDFAARSMEDLADKLGVSAARPPADRRSHK